MAFPTHIPLFDSGTGGLTTREDGQLQRELTLKWLVPKMDSYQMAEEKGEELAPLDSSGHRRTRLSVRSLGNKWYEIEATYENTLVQQSDNNDNNDDGGVANTISFDTSGGTEHITQAFQAGNGNAGQQVVGTFTGIYGQLGHARPGEGDQVPALEGAINVEGDQVKGTDKVVPIFNFTETWVFPSAFLVSSYIGTLYKLTGTVNRTDWRVFKGGEVLFLGARGEITRGAATASITFQFSARPNRGTFKVGEVEVTGGKLGWEQMSVMYETASSDASLIRRPKFVFINAVYGAYDFTQLSIGDKFPAVYQPNQPFAT